MTDIIDVLSRKAIGQFRNGQGFNCAQSVLMTIAEYWKIKDEMIPKIATAFVGGMGMCSSVCGAVTGGLMAIGIKYGTSKPYDESIVESKRAIRLSEIFYRKFEEQNGSVICRELISLDLSKAEQLKKALKEQVFEKKCPLLVKSAVEIIVSIEQDNL